MSRRIPQFLHEIDPAGDLSTRTTPVRIRGSVSLDSGRSGSHTSPTQMLFVAMSCLQGLTASGLEEWRATYAGIAPWVAVTRRSAVTCDRGWEVATGPGGRIELSLAGWHDEATPLALREIVDALPRDQGAWLAPSRHWAPLPEDAGRLAAAAGRPIRVAPR